MDVRIFQVGMAELVVQTAPGKLVTLGLGSCVAVCGYDPAVRVAAMAHVMLPNSPEKGEFNPAKFGDTAVPMLLDQMQKKGAYLPRIWIKIVGGAKMFSFSTSDVINVGARNVEAISEACSKLGVKISVQRVGGTMGRSVYMDIETGDIEVKTINQGSDHI